MLWTSFTAWIARCHDGRCESGDAAAQTKPEDLPPPPGMLLEHGPVLPPDQVVAPGNGKLLSHPLKIPYFAEGGHILIEASINGGPAKPFYFDTGARNTIGAATLEQIAVSILDMRNIIVDRGSKPPLAGLIGSELLARYAVTIDFARHCLILDSPGFRQGFGKKLQIGPFTLSSPVISGTAESRGFVLGFGSVGHLWGVIGNAILAQFIVTIDYQSVRAYFEPVPGRALPTALHGTGMILDKPDHEAFEVLDIIKGTAAERAGLHRGDRVIEIAGRAARDLGIADVAALTTFPAHRSMAIRTSDQRRIDLTIDQLLP